VPRSVVVIGIGNDLRGDDAAGLAVARRIAAHPHPQGVRVEAHDGEAIGLLEVWEGADAVLLVDTVRSGAPAGSIHRIDASRTAIPATLRRASSHTIDASEVIELARVLDRLPGTVVVYGIEGERFAAGAELSSAVSGVLDQLADELTREAAALAAT
jgi:hydrogenase maturation protease